jgi:hypothetical protein
LTLDDVLDVADYDLRGGAARPDAGHGKGDSKLRDGTGSHEHLMDARVFMNDCEVAANYASGTWCDQAPLAFDAGSNSASSSAAWPGRAMNVKSAVFECEFVRTVVCIPDGPNSRGSRMG